MTTAITKLYEALELLKKEDFHEMFSGPSKVSELIEAALEDLESEPPKERIGE